MSSKVNDNDSDNKEEDVSPGPSEDQGKSVTDGPSWMPKLSSFVPSDDFLKAGPRGSSSFDLKELLGAIQGGQFDAEAVHTYLSSRDEETLKQKLNERIEGYPAIFYVVSTNNIGIIREWIKHGGDPNATRTSDGFPLIAFSILKGGKSLAEAIRTLATLLRLGADPRVIPQAFYEPYCRDLPEDGPIDQDLCDIGDTNKRWCTADVRSHLTRALNLSQRYDLYRSSKAKLHSGREKQLLVRQGAEEVLGIHQMVVAQSSAIRSLTKRLLV